MRRGEYLRILVTAAASAVIAVGAHPAAAQTPPADAEPAASTWCETLSQSLRAAAQPVYAARAWAGSAGAWAGSWIAWGVGLGESALTTEKRAFVATLKGDLAAFERRVGEAGFKVGEIRVSGGLDPEIGLTLEVRTGLNDVEETALRRRIDEDYAGAGLIGRIERALLLALLDVDEGAAAVRPNGYALTGVDIDVGLIPSFSYAFSPAAETAAAPAAETAAR